MKIIILKGLPASGKSTYAKNLIAENPNTYKRINKDDLRAMLDNSHWSKSNETFVLRMRDFAIRQALQDWLTPIIDDTNLHPKHTETIKNIAKEFNVECEVIEFNTPVFECIERDLKRANPVGGKVILNMFNQFVRPNNDSIGTPAIICDIDGTIAKMNGRHPFEWNRVGEDLPKLEIIGILEKFHATHKIILMSGRDGISYQSTLDWLDTHNVLFDKMYMRRNNDNRKDDIIKTELYEKYIKGKYRIEFVLDDRNQVVDMWRGLGITCLQVDYGNF